MIRSHLVTLVVFSALVSTVFSATLLRDTLRERIRFGLLAFAAFVLSTLAVGWLTNPFQEGGILLRIEDREKFISALTTDMPEAPDHFSRCSDVNRKGPALARMLPILMPLDPALFSKKVQETNTLVLDVRSYEAFGGQHVAHSFHIDINGNFATFSGWVLPPDSDILLVAETPEKAREAVIGLRRVGLDRSVGYLEGGMYEWAKAGLPTEHICQFSAEQLHKRMTVGQPVTLLDVRAKREFQTGTY